MTDKDFKAVFDKKGRLVLPKEIAEEYGFAPDTEIRIRPSVNGLQLRPPVTRLAKVYIEPTNRCNLECRTCIRHGWNEPTGEMNVATFAGIAEGLRPISPPPRMWAIAIM